MDTENKITPEQEKKYVKDGGVYCPFCEAVSCFEQASTELYPSNLFLTLVCQSCGREWSEHYKLVGILETTDERNHLPLMRITMKD